MHPPMRKTTAAPPSHQVSEILTVKQEIINKMQPIA